MYTTLDHLASHKHSTRPSSWWRLREICVFLLFLFGASIASSVFVNAQVFMDAIWSFIPSFAHSHAIVPSEDTGSLASTVNQSTSRHQLEQSIKTILTQHDTDTILPVQVWYDQTIKSKLNNYQLTFNTVAPTNRLIISSIWLNVPIVDIPFKTQEHKDKGSYEKELYQWVVKYPTTPMPSQPWNVFLFGHTSFYRWKNNPYGTVFKDLPKVKEADTIIIQREGKEYHYQMIARHIVTPKQVNGIYEQYNDGDYITLMGCYPIGSDEKRILIIAKKL